LRAQIRRLPPVVAQQPVLQHPLSGRPAWSSPAAQPPVYTAQRDPRRRGTLRPTPPPSNPVSTAPAGVDPQLAEKLAQRGDLTLRKTDLPAALFTIGEEWGVSVVVGQGVEGQVNGAFRGAPLHEILDSILLCNGFGYRPVGRSLVVMPLKDLGDLNPMFSRATVTLQYADPTAILPSVRLLSSPHGRVEAVAAARSLIVLDFADRVEMIRRFAADVDAAAGAAGAGPTDEVQPIRVLQIAPQFASAEALLPSVETVLSKEGKASAALPDNRLVVADYQAHLDLVRQLVAQLDVPRQQVRITALIYDLSVADVERLGINWYSAAKARHNASDEPQSVFNIDSLISVPVGADLPNGVMTFMNLSRHFDITAVVQALQEARDSRLLANPNVTVLDHEKATVTIVSEIPYQELTQTQQGGQIGTTAFREAGVKLDVTPHIASDGTIRLEVTPEFSALTGYTPGAQAQPIIDRREAKTTVRVTNGQVLVIGGLRQRNDTGNFNGLPYLKDIKLLNMGALFRGRDTEVRESELVVFIMPEIVSTSYVGTPRDATAFQYGECLLDQVPTATGGHPPHRLLPHCPPTPMGGPRVLGTPYQPQTCPDPSMAPPTEVVTPDAVAAPPAAENPAPAPQFELGPPPPLDSPPVAPSPIAPSPLAAPPAAPLPGEYPAPTEYYQPANTAAEAPRWQPPVSNSPPPTDWVDPMTPIPRPPIGHSSQDRHPPVQHSPYPALPAPPYTSSPYDSLPPQWRNNPVEANPSVAGPQHRLSERFFSPQTPPPTHDSR